MKHYCGCHHPLIPVESPHMVRLSFPSWSWAGWSGGAEYFYSSEALSRVMWRDVSTGELFSSEEYRGPDTVRSNWVKSKEISVFQSYYEENTPHMQFLHPTALDYQNRSREFIKRGSEVLEFHTLSAKFQISDHGRGGPIGRCDDGVHKICNMGEYNKKGLQSWGRQCPRNNRMFAKIRTFRVSFYFPEPQFAFRFFV